MGLPDHRKALRVTCVAALVALVVSAAAIGQAGAQSTSQTQPSSDDSFEFSLVSVLDVDFVPTNRARLLGHQARGVVSVVLANRSEIDANDVRARIEIADRTYYTAPVTVPASGTVRVRLQASLGGISFRERDVIATVGQSQATTTHRVVPWLLIALVGLTINVVLVVGRDQLRAAVTDNQ